jgi:hypothetical protein
MLENATRNTSQGDAKWRMAGGSLDFSLYTSFLTMVVTMDEGTFKIPIP